MINVWLHKKIYDKIVFEANAKAPLETGGILAGYRTLDDRDLVITEVVGPGPNAKHRKTRFTPDYAHHKKKIGEIYDRNKGRISYLGDWHTHPKSPAYLSWLDRRALKNIAREPRNYMDNPIMLVLGNEEGGSAWSPYVWRILRAANNPLWARWEYLSLNTKIY